MSENGNGNPPIQFVTPPKFQMTITVDQSGNINVSGPIQDKILSFGLLELAKEAISEHHKNMQKQILVARPALKI